MIEKLVKPWVAVTLPVTALLIAFGCASAPPTAFEQRMFNIQTNLTSVVEVRTNIVPVTLVKTNIVEVTQTNVQGVVVTQPVTNYVPILVYQTNTVPVTNVLESYVYTPGQGAQNVKEVGTAVGNVFGVGGLVGTALGALFSLWGVVRSRKNYLTSANLAQTVETVRAFVQQLPNGAAYDTALVQWMQNNQANAGVLNQVLTLLKNEVSNNDAQQAVKDIQTLLGGLQQGTAPGAPIPAPAHA